SVLNYSRHAYLYTAAELNIPSGAKIIKLEWLKNNTFTVTGNNTFNMWLGNTTATTLPTNSAWGTLLQGMTQVYSSTTFSVTGGANTYQGAQFNIPGSDSIIYTGGSLEMLVDWIKNGTSNGTVNFYVSTATNKSIGLANNVPFTNSSILSTTTYGNSRPTIRITYVPVPPCSGTPVTGPVFSSVASACPGVPFTLNITNTLTGGGISYQWQSADDSAFTLNVSTLGTAASQNATQTSAKYYRCIATCASGPTSYTSPSYLMPMSPLYMCACSSAALSDADEEIFNFSIATFSNSSNCSSVGPGPGSLPQLYSNYQTLTPATVEKGSTIPFSIGIGTCLNNYQNVSAVFIDFNQNGVYSDAGEQVYSSPSPGTGAHTESGTITIPTTALTGTCGVRVITSEQIAPITNPCLVYSWGETEDYTLNIVPAGTCNGTPQAGNTTSNFSSVCAGQGVILGLQNWILGSGIQYQWYNSAGPISGATSYTYSSGALTNAETFYCKVTCINSGLYSFSNPVTIT
ncbi:MAG TPA: GEVED domain-containing protein, partial [Chitinophagaceae bacterium]|nr:GEVED domain-containing protein [Chitinophagaceae bacterium]